MDEMRIVTKFTKGIISKIVKKIIRKKTGYDINFQFNSLVITIDDGRAKLHMDVDAELDKDVLNKILKDTGLN